MGCIANKRTVILEKSVDEKSINKNDKTHAYQTKIILDSKIITDDLIEIKNKIPNEEHKKSTTLPDNKNEESKENKKVDSSKIDFKIIQDVYMIQEFQKSILSQKQNRTIKNSTGRTELLKYATKNVSIHPTIKEEPIIDETLGLTEKKCFVKSINDVDTYPALQHEVNDTTEQTTNRESTNMKMWNFDKSKIMQENQNEKEKKSNFLDVSPVNYINTGTPISIKLPDDISRKNKVSYLSDLGSNLDFTDLSPSSPNKILRKFNINPYYNFHAVKKYFIYQIKKGFLQAKKFIVNNKVHNNNPDKKLNYFEIFSNYSQINSSEATTYVKYEDHDVKLNNYYIKKNKLLGKGGYSSVYLSTNLSDNKEYAVKVTDKKTRANAKKTKYEYVKEEVSILKRVCSKYIVKTYEIIETKAETFIIMEFMKNNSLLNNISRLDEFKTWKYFRNLLCGLEHCHEIAKIVHRDINVNNLLISDDDVLKISDFGVSMIIEEGNDLIPINSGPTTYTPPEKKASDVTHFSGKKADVWCCGVTLYHMIYKKPLFKNFGNLDHIDYRIELPEDGMDPNLRELMIKMLEENPDLRCDLNYIKKNHWVTKYGEFPLPDIFDEALEYVYSITSKEIHNIKQKTIQGDRTP